MSSSSNSSSSSSNSVVVIVLVVAVVVGIVTLEMARKASWAQGPKPTRQINNN